MNYYEYVFIVFLMLVLADQLLPQAHLWIVVSALLLAAIRRENTYGPTNRL